MANILKLIEKNGLKNFYLLYGSEVYLKNYYISQIQKKIIPNDFLDMNLNVFNDDAKKIIDAAMALPFMNNYRLIIIKDSDFFYSGKKDDVDLILKYINDFPETSIIIFCESKIDKRNRLYKKICELGECLEIKKPSDKELTNWIIKICQAQNKLISQDNASLILKNINGDMIFIKNELDKIISYKKNSDIITREDIDLLCVKSMDAKIFELVADIANKNLEAALINYNNLLFLKEQPLVILSMIARQFILVFQTKIFSQEQKKLDAIANLLGVKNFVVIECLKQAKNFSCEQLINLIKACLDIDYKIKTGKLIDKLAIESLIIKSCSL